MSAAIDQQTDAIWWSANMPTASKWWHNKAREILDMPDASDHRIRAAAKRTARQGVADPSLTLAQRVTFYEWLLNTHWLRSWEASDMHPMHPCRLDYLRCCAASRGVVPDEVWAGFAERHDLTPSPWMPEGRSYFDIGRTLTHQPAAAPMPPMVHRMREIGAVGLLTSVDRARRRYVPIATIAASKVVTISWCGRYSGTFGRDELLGTMLANSIKGETVTEVRSIWVAETKSYVVSDVRQSTGDWGVFDKSHNVHGALRNFIPAAGTPARQAMRRVVGLDDFMEAADGVGGEA